MVEMQELQLPGYAFKIRTSPQGEQIFDTVRKKYIFLTPEEWVRQHFINFLVEHRQCPVSLMKVESGIKWNGMDMRSDIVVHDRNGKPLAIVECKAPNVPISSSTFEQIFRYDRVLNAEYLLLTNGNDHYCCQLDRTEKSFKPLKEIPVYAEMIFGCKASDP